ncbi:hypothetical protein Btru_075422 [Bulinus truncatus]|nr:hypothetical protein Btru_075422 [Bulinus truncatus]
MEIIRVREHLCNAEKLVGYARRAGGEHGDAIVYCATSSPEASIRERAPFEHYQETLCTALNMNSTYHCAILAGANAAVYNKVLVSACTVSFDSLLGIEDVCINIFTSCLQRLQPRNCSALLNGVSCNRNLCQLFSLKYLLNATCKTLNLLSAVMFQLNDLLEECLNLVWSCLLLTTLPVEYWVDRSKVHR